MTGIQWADLPADVLGLVEARVGHIDKAENVGAGSVRDLAATLQTDSGLFFCKGIRADASFAWMHRNELKVNPSLPEDTVPRIRWTVEANGWHLLGFDHVSGHHPDLSPGSPDLDLVAGALRTLSSALTPCPVAVQPFTKRWAGLIESSLVDGDTLVHTDVTPRNFLLHGNRVWVVDWSMPSRGAAWIDTALMVVRLISAGHDPSQAQEWAARIPAWAQASQTALAAFAHALAALTEQRHATAPAPHRAELAAAAKRWAAYRASPSQQSST
jgi:hypothetical protein